MLRKKNWNTEHIYFPGESPLQFRRTGLRTVGAAASLSEAWLRCGEGFQDTYMSQSLITKRKTATGKHLELSPKPKKEATTSKSTNDLTDITWSSSGSDLSDEEKTLCKSQTENENDSRIDRFCKSNILFTEDGVREDELQFIDWEIDSDKEDASECYTFADSESVEISDCASCASSQSLASEEKLSELHKTRSTEILEYSSDSEREDGSKNVFFTDSESSHKYHMDFGSDRRQFMERLINPRVNPTESTLCTPQKQTKFHRTLENSAKKRKLLRGGLAERIYGLQNRERSAISMWKCQCSSSQKTPSGRKSGLLMVRILELHEECSIQVAMCEQLVELQTDSSSQCEAPRTGLKVLFTKETAGYLRGHPQDIIHIYPPWQKLIIPNESYPVILNTYFCKKVVAKEHSKTTHEMRCWGAPLQRRNITLAQMFRFKSLMNDSLESQVMCSGLTIMGKDWTHRHREAKQHFPAQPPLRDSLLDAVEMQGAGTWSGVGVRVVVQRVYSLPYRCQMGGGSIAPLSSEPAKVRVCLLVQDACGMFSEVHTEDTVLKDKQLEGKSCSLTGMKVLQKATRGRSAGLFSLIDTMWPPAVALETAGSSPSCGEVKTHLPLPSFCYILTAHPNLGNIDIIEDPISKLYQPPIPRLLREILQTADLSTRCSFYARVIYQRSKLNSLLLAEQREIWLIVTDVTLQMQNEDKVNLPKTMLVCVSSSCVLSPEVQEALSEATSHSFLFRDTLRDQGRIVCVERTVLLLLESHLGMASRASSCELTNSVRLDELNPFTQDNSICSVRGTVVGVDESTAFSWPTCDLCGNGRLEQRPEDSGTFFCGNCSRVVTSPLLRRHLQVFLDCPSRPQCTVRVKLLQSSISSLLRFAACEDGTYEVKSILGTEVEFLNCFVQSITTHPASCAGLEEIELLRAGRACVEHRPLP
ncbi:DNA repair-scaffolding protein isoform X2 [Talpa occidentalis]|uniref:DNA repair-scaffolding protein isoform X2 n=1 Tax=Talpa occidentalis TaxID=50954 RepID=UPI0023F6515B|nr:DNA repair-scaffolding protein isoform X2 [Talpa occidentalis]XP_054548254.1 DNA repair-scaffolding protein isoform X2 [Talpa occidentalis]